MLRQNKQILKSLILCLVVLSYKPAIAQMQNIKKIHDQLPTAGLNIDKNLTSFIPTEKNLKDNENGEIRFIADELIQDKDTGIITANGNVEIDYKNMNITAQKVVFDQKTEHVEAFDDVVFVEPDGSVVFSDYFEITGDMKNAVLNDVKIVLADKSRLAANKATRINANKKVLDKAIYTSCDVCRGEDPVWQIKANKVTHDEVKQNVMYEDAVLELGGTPIFYTPYLSHPDPKVKRRSGFLTPRLGGNNNLGMTLQPTYYWAASDYQDFTFSPIFTSKEGIVYTGEYRQNFMDSEIVAKGSITQDSEYEVRGHIFLNARHEIDDNWVSKMQIESASSDNFLDKYDFEKEHEAWLNSYLKFEGFDNRNYMGVELHDFQIISDNFKGEDEPIVLPYFDYHNIGEIGKYGAYSEMNLNAYAMSRDEGNNQRLSARTSWNLPYLSPGGSSYKLSAQLQTDFYNASDYIDNNGEEFDGSTVRFNPNISLEWKHPFVKSTENYTSIIEPVVVAIASPTDENINDDITNEDSRDINLDDTNLLEVNRYNGFDSIETGSRINYGINVNAYGHESGKASLFLGQSYKLDNNDTAYGGESNNEDNLSDYIGRIYASPNDNFDLVYRFRFNKDTLKPEYNELATAIGPPIFRTGINYVFLEEDEDGIRDDFGERKELYLTVSSAMTKNWSTKLYSRFDLSDDVNKEESLLEYGADLIYDDECFQFDADISKDFSDYNNYDAGLSITFTLTFKTLGVVSTGG